MSTDIMTKDDRELLLKDLCCRLPYGVKCSNEDNIIGILSGKASESSWVILTKENKYEAVKDIKPYLRPMSSMTVEERDELIGMTIMRPDYIYGMALFSKCYKNSRYIDNWGCCSFKTLDWLNSHHFDYRDLISKGLALEAPKDMYK